MAGQGQAAAIPIAHPNTCCRSSLQPATYCQQQISIDTAAYMCHYNDYMTHCPTVDSHHSLAQVLTIDGANKQESLSTYTSMNCNAQVNRDQRPLLIN